MTATKGIDPKALFEAGAHFGRSKSRRHPTAGKYLFGTKNKSDLFDVEETAKRLEVALEKVAAIVGTGKQVLFVGGKHEVISVVRQAAEKAGAPFVAGRWIGGTLTNFKQIRRRIDRMEKLMQERERGERDKYTKLERLMLDREIEELENRFGGLTEMRELPGALFAVDAGHEHIAISEARQMKVPVIALLSSDCDFSVADFPIPGNDSSLKSVRLIVNAVADNYVQNKKASSPKEPGKESAHVEE